MSHTIAKEFNLSSLLQFALPSIVMMVFLSLYSIVDGIFVSNFVGTDALSAINLVYPFLNIILAVGIMLATGGSAVVARQMGTGDKKAAMESFSLIIYVGIGAGVLIGLIGITFLEPIVRLLGASGELIPYCKDYLGLLLLFTPASILQMLFQSFFVTTGRPGIGLGLTIGAGLTNGILDYVFIKPMNMGIGGAALATAIGYLVPALVGLWYFCKYKDGLHLVPVKIKKQELAILKESCFNGSSEMVTNLSTGVITFLFNGLMLSLLGKDGVAAITIILYGQFLLTALFMGFSIGVGPVISYNYGSGNTAQLARIYRYCRGFILTASVVMFALAVIFAKPIVGIFSPQGTPVYEIAIWGFFLFSFSYLFAGMNIFASAMFTALSDGRTSAIISFLRTFVFIILGILFLPYLLKVDGVWLAVPFAELVTCLFSYWYLKKGRAQYKYA